MQTEQRGAEEETLEKRLRFEQMLSDLSARVMAAPFDQVDSALDHALRQIMEFFDVDRCALLEIREDKAFARVTHAVYGDGIERVSGAINLVELFPWCYERLIHGKHINICRVEDYPEEAQRDRQSHVAMDTKSALNIPVAVGGGGLRSIVIQHIRRHHAWPEEYIPRLRLLGEILVNALERRDDRLKVEELLRFETLMAEISARFVGLPADQVDGEVEDAQRRVCECLGLDFSSLWQRESERPDSLVLTHYYRRLDGPPLPERMRAAEFFPWTLREVLAGRRVVVSSMDNVPEGASRDVESWRQFSIKTALVFPLSAGGGALLGALSFDDIAMPRTWSEALINRLELVAEVFANAIVRKHIEVALRESEQRLTLSLDAAGAGAWSMDVESGRVWVSDRERELFGFAANEPVTYDSFQHVIHPDDREGVRAAVENALRTKSRFVVEYRIVRPDGCVRWIVARGQPDVDAKAGPDRLTGISLDITERKQKEESLRLSEACVAAATDAAGLGFYETGEDARVVFLDDRIRAMLGVPPDEGPRGREFWLAHIHPEDFPRLQEESRGVQSGGRDRLVSEYRYVHPSRGILWLHHVSRVLDRNAAGRAVRAVGAIWDITERKRAEDGLREHAENFRALTSTTTDAFWLVDEEGRIIDANDEVCRLYGYSRAELLSMSVQDFEVTRDAAETRRHIAMISEAGYSRFETRHCCKDKRIVDIEVSTSYRPSSGTFFAFLRDITSRKQREADLRASEELNRATFEQAAMGLAYVGFDGHFLRVNDRVCAIVGYPRDELLKLTFQEITHTDDLEKDLSHVRQVLSGEIGNYSMEKRYIRKDRSVVWVNLTVSLIRAIAGEPVHFLSVIEDITARVEAEQALRQKEFRLTSAIDVAELGFYEEEGTAENRVTFPDNRVRSVVGLPPDLADDGMREYWFAHVQVDDRQRVIEWASGFDEAGGQDHVAIEYRYRHETRGLVWLRHLVHALARDPAGRVVRLIGVMLDITERKAAEEKLRRTLEEVRRLRDQLQNENVYLRKQMLSESGHGSIVGESEPVCRMLAMARKVAPTDSAVLITGETGTGKELLAQAIHDLSSRRKKLMVKVNCAALPAPLIESELFGREKGAYTGAMTQQVGRFEVANGSSIFLDEIGDLPMDLQVKLLRILQDGLYERLGSTRTLKSDVRVIAATNRDLAAMIREGKFREDLFHRLNVFPIEVPPLRERTADIPHLVWTFVQEFNVKMGLAIDSIQKSTMERLKQYAWPGNIRELRNVIERAMIVSEGSSLRIDLPAASSSLVSPPSTLEELERNHIHDVLARTHWRISGKGGAAEILGLVPTTLHSRMKKLGISRPER